MAKRESMTKTAFLFAAIAAPILAQSTIKDALVKHWKASGDLTIAVAKAMPAESYSFRPNDEEMSFGQLMGHIGTADVMACSAASGLPAIELPAKVTAFNKDKKTEVDRDTAVQFLTDTFAFCNKAVSGVTLEQLDKIAGPANRNLTGYEWLWSYFTHTAHHRGQAEVYLRVKGIKPPTYVF
jgi:uncharacterized damage-inducible protein DinB